jgi:L-ascorbate metabolism protein UlaG (beta-lactamase superfamily)
VYAVPTEPGAIDTTGYLLQFANGRSVYHSSDTAYSDLLLAAAPHAEVLLTVINGNWGNLTPQQAVTLAQHVRPRAAIPMHYDVMALNSQNPQTFAYFAHEAMPDLDVPILPYLKPFCWSAE